MVACGGNRIIAGLRASFFGAVSLLPLVAATLVIQEYDHIGPTGFAALMALLASLAGIFATVSARYLKYVTLAIVLRMDQDGLFFPISYDRPIPWSKVTDVYTDAASLPDQKIQAATVTEMPSYTVSLDPSIKVRFWIFFKVSQLQIRPDLLAAKESDINGAFAKFAPNGIRIIL